MIYVDPSVLVGLLLRDAHSERGMELLAGTRSPVAFTKLVELETRNALQLAVYRQAGVEAVVDRAQERLTAILNDGRWIPTDLDYLRVVNRAHGLSRGHSRNLGTRSMDIMHVASAMELGVFDFWSFDERQRNLAERVGLRVNR